MNGASVRNAITKFKFKSLNFSDMAAFVGVVQSLAVSWLVLGGEVGGVCWRVGGGGRDWGRGERCVRVWEGVFSGGRGSGARRGRGLWRGDLSWVGVGFRLGIRFRFRVSCRCGLSVLVRWWAGDAF